MANRNSDKKDTKDKLKSCRLCGGSGKVHLRCDDTDILGSKAAEQPCPVCRGRGKTGTNLRPMKLRFRKLPKKLPITKGRSQGGRPSRSSHLLPMPGTPLTGYPEGDMVPKSIQESVYHDANIECPIVEYHKKKDDDEEPDEDRDDCPAENDTEIILDLPEGVTIRKQFASDMVLGSDPIAINFQEGLKAALDHGTAPVVYSAEDGEPAVIEPDRANIETDISVPGAASIDVLGPAMSGQADTLDVIGVEDPAGFDINTDVTGNAGF